MTRTDKTALAGRLDKIGMVTPSLAEGQKPDNVRDIETITGEILEAKRVGGEAVLTIGRGLIEAKAMLDHGDWLPWLTERVEFSERSAQNFMRLAREWSNPQALADLGATKALQLLALPEPEREEFVAGHNVVDMTSRELEKAIKERDEARKAAEQAQVDSRAAEEARRSMEESLKMANELAARSQESQKQYASAVADLEKQLAELKAAPVDVAVMAVDQEAIDKAKAEAVAELQAKLDKAQEAKKKSDEKRKHAEAVVDTLKLQLAEASKAKQQAAAMADSEFAEFNVCFNQAQNTVNMMRGLLLKIRGREDQTLARQLTNALLALSDKIKEAAQ